MSENEPETGTNPIKWAIHDTHPELVQPLREALSQVMDPEIHLSVIQLGLIRQVEIENDNVKIKMILTTPFCPYGPEMIETTRKKVQDSINKLVTIELDMEMWDFSMMEDPGAIAWGMYD